MRGAKGKRPIPCIFPCLREIGRRTACA